MVCIACFIPGLPLKRLRSQGAYTRLFCYMFGVTGGYNHYLESSNGSSMGLSPGPSQSLGTVSVRWRPFPYQTLKWRPFPYRCVSPCPRPCPFPPVSGYPASCDIRTIIQWLHNVTSLLLQQMIKMKFVCIGIVLIVLSVPAHAMPRANIDSSTIGECTSAVHYTKLVLWFTMYI